MVPARSFLRIRLACAARRFGPNGEPGSKPAGAGAMNVFVQHGQTPPCNITRVTSGLISGISIRS
jgi:hypothetical protein